MFNLCKLGFASVLLCLGLGWSLAAIATAPSTSQPKDPTQPPTRVRQQADTGGSIALPKQKLPVLTSILTSEERRLAVINGKLVREGELVAGMRVVRVAKDEVQLKSSKHARALVLRLPKSNIGKDYR